METKKHLKKDVRTKRTLFLQLGFIFAISICLWAFSWQKTLHEDIIKRIYEEDTIAPLPPIIKESKPQAEDKKPTPPKPKTSLTNLVVDDITTSTSETVTITKLNEFQMPTEQTIEIPPIAPGIVLVTYIMPEFKGGQKKREEYFQDHVLFDHDGRYDGQKKVWVGFIVHPDGSISDVEILQAFDNEAAMAVLAAFKNMPKWEPGRNSLGQLCTVRVRLPIIFDFRK